MSTSEYTNNTRKRKLQSQFVTSHNTNKAHPTDITLHPEITSKHNKLSSPLTDLPQPQAITGALVSPTASTTGLAYSIHHYVCSYVSCSNKLIDTSTDSRVEVKTYLNSDRKVASSRTGSWRVNWSIEGEATFHGICWEELSRLSKSRRKISPVFVSQEKAMIKEAIKTAEFHDSLLIIQQKACLVAQMLLASKHCIVFTGAGISTSAGIGDYRGKSGKWTVEDLTTREPDSTGSDEEGVQYDKLRPTYTHEAIQLLVEKGFIKHVVSQNGDGLHLLSGVPVEKLSELHGNVFVESCEKCKQMYYRDYYTLDDYASMYYEEAEDNGSTDIIKPKHAKKCGLCGLNHRTGRKCEQPRCNGQLVDSIINFKDLLSESILTKATEQATMNDMCLSLGTTMQVYPACDLVEKGVKPLRLVICNRQSTPFDDLCYDISEDSLSTDNRQLGCRVYGDCDLFMKEVLKHILKYDELKTWEELRGERLIQYDSLRKS